LAAALNSASPIGAFPWVAPGKNCVLKHFLPHPLKACGFSVPGCVVSNPIKTMTYTRFSGGEGYGPGLLNPSDLTIVFR